MLTLLDIQFLPLLPCMAAGLLALVPQFDSLTQRKLSLWLLIAWFIFIFFLLFNSYLSFNISFLLLIQTVIFFGIPFDALLWWIMALSVATIQATDPIIFLTLAYAHVAFLFFIVLHRGGIYKGSASYETILFFLVLDLSALFALSWSHAGWAYWILILPGLARVLFLLTAPFSRHLFVNCPNEIMLLILANMVPVGLAWLIQIKQVLLEPERFRAICLGVSILAIALFFFERSRRQKAIYLLMSQTSLCAFAILAKAPIWGLGMGLVALLNSALWIYWLNSSIMHVFNMLVSAGVLFALVYRT